MGFAARCDAKLASASFEASDLSAVSALEYQDLRVAQIQPTVQCLLNLKEKASDRGRGVLSSTWGEGIHDHYCVSAIPCEVSDA